MAEGFSTGLTPSLSRRERADQSRRARAGSVRVRGNAHSCQELMKGIDDREIAQGSLPAGHEQVIIIQHEEKIGSMEFGTEGWKLDPELETDPSDIYVRKTATDSFHKPLPVTFSLR